MSHNAYVKGLIENGCDVDIIMAKSSFGAEDKALPHWREATYYEYETATFGERLRARLRDASKKVILTPNQSFTSPTSKNNSAQQTSIKSKLFTPIKSCLRSIFLSLFRPDPLYPLDAQIFKSVLSFKAKHRYDLVISNSSPAASHKIVEILNREHKIEYVRWIQIWEDPWFYDLYGGHDKMVLEEEHRLLQAASEILYVSPLTLEYQKKYFPDCASKMGFVPLPYFEYEKGKDQKTNPNDFIFGYFGDYYSHTRNLKPFYDAIIQTHYEAYINGDTDLCLESTPNIHIGGRVTLDVLASIQEKTNVLVHLCNLRGGQIPGKIYHYSATNKKILFILDGTDEEQETLRRVFSAFNRYYFCRNTPEDILRVIKEMTVDKNISNNIVKEFAPQNIVKSFI